MDDGEKKNKLVESVELFKTIIKWFQNIPIIIYFNKTDEFEEKIKTTSHLADYFPQFEGPKNDPIVAKKFIFQMFFKDVTKKNGISEENLLNLGNEEICTSQYLNSLNRSGHGKRCLAHFVLIFEAILCNRKANCRGINVF